MSTQLKDIPEKTRWSLRLWPSSSLLAILLARSLVSVRFLLLMKWAAAVPVPGDNTTKQTRFAIRPFRVNIPETELVELRQRIAAMRWPEKETVADQSQGVQLATIQELARYWATEYDWRTCEAKLNGYPQFITEIDGLDIHFLHIRSNHEHLLLRITLEVNDL